MTIAEGVAVNTAGVLMGQADGLCGAGRNTSAARLYARPLHWLQGFRTHPLDAQTDAWGIKVANVEIKHVDLNEVMIRATAPRGRASRGLIRSARASSDAATKRWCAAESMALDSPSRRV